MIPLVVIVGATAVGKSAIGVQVARTIGGEVISGDSMQVYRGMDVGTAKLTPAEMQGVPHHLIDILDPVEPFSAADFQERAHRLIREIDGRGKIPLLVGGTGLYVQSVVDEYDFPEMGVDLDLRERLRREADAIGPDHLHALLSRVDPTAAARIHPNDRKRMIRALEVYHLTGRPISSYGRVARQEYRPLMFGIAMDRDRLYRRIDERVDGMFASGLVDEVRGLLDRGCGPDLNSMQGLGYRQVAGYLLGRYNLAEAVRSVKRETRKFAKRQQTWFRRDPRIMWLEMGENSSNDEKNANIREIGAKIAHIIGRTINNGVE